MSSPQLRRQDRMLGEADARELIAQAYLRALGNDRGVQGVHQPR